MPMMSCILFLLSAVSAQHTASLAPLAATSPSPSAPSQRLAAFDAHTGDRQEAGEGRHLVVLGAVLAGACIFSGVILGFLLLSSVAGLAVPLLGALPSTSAAVFAMQVLAVGSTSPLNDLAVPLRWMAPQPDSMLVGCILLLAFVWLARRAALRLHRKQLDQSSAEPHGLSPGSWELRALGLVAFPLAAASTQLAASLDQADSALAGLVVSTVILCFLTNQAVLAFRFLHQAWPGRASESERGRDPPGAGGGQRDAHAAPGRRWPGVHRQALRRAQGSAPGCLAWGGDVRVAGDFGLVGGSVGGFDRGDRVDRRGHGNLSRADGALQP